jgi:hypothetical protein
LQLTAEKIYDNPLVSGSGPTEKLVLAVMALARLLCQAEKGR